MCGRSLPPIRCSVAHALWPQPATTCEARVRPIDENITVLSGVFCVGMGDTFDEHACRDMPAGSYIVMPKGMHHFAVAKGDVVQAHGIGPFKIHWVK